MKVNRSLRYLLDVYSLMEDENITSNSRPNKPQNKKLFESDSEPVTESKSDEPVIESSVNMITESEPEKPEDESGSSGVDDTPAEIPKASSTFNLCTSVWKALVIV